MIDWIGVSIPFVAMVSYMTLLGLVLSRGKKTRATQTFGLFLLLFGIWALGSMCWHLTASLVWNRILVTGATLAPICFLYFVRAFLDLKGRFVAYLAAGAVPIVLVVTWSGLAVTGSYMENGIAHMRLGAGFAVLMTLTTAANIWSMIQLVRRYRAKSDSVSRYRVQYVMVGLGIWWIGAFTNSLPTIGNYPIDIACSAVNAVLIAVAILKHQLLDITVVVRRGLAYSLLTASVAAVYLLSVFVLQALLQHLLGGQSYLSAALMAIGFAVLYEPVRRRSQSWIDRVFFRERVDMQAMIAEVSRTTAAILELDRLGDLILDSVVNSMAVTKAILYVGDRETGEFQPRSLRGISSDTPINLAADHPVVTLLRESDVVLRQEAIVNLPSFRGLWARERRDLDALGGGLFAPIRLKGELVGVLAVGPKRSESAYLPEEEMTFKTLGNQIAVAIGNARLVAELQHSLNDLRQMQTQLVEAGKLSAVGQLVAGVAHELNNPLTTIKGYAQLLCNLDLPNEVRRDLGRIDEAAERCRRIVQNLLTFARRHGAEMSMCNINEIIESTLALQGYQFRLDNVDTAVDLQADMPYTAADRYQLQQVLFNIFGNAQQAMRLTGGGVLRVTSRVVNEHIKVAISDTGPGMTPEVRSRIFEPFFTTKGVGEGTGLGLSICYGIVQDHGGRILVESEPGLGSTFVVDLPIRQCPWDTATESDSSGAAVSPHGMLHILVVDDEEAILSLVKRILGEEGFVVDGATTGLEALRCLEDKQGRGYDLILSDVKMPGLDGPRLYAYLKENRPALVKRVVFMTGDTSSYETHRFLESARVRYIAKPFGLDDLRQLVNSQLKAESE